MGCPGIIQEHAPQVLTHAAEHEHLHASKKDDTDQDRGNPDGQILGYPDLVDNGHDDQQDTNQGKKAAEENGNAQWLDRKVQEHVQPQANQLAYRVARLTSLTILVLDIDLSQVMRGAVNQAIDVRKGASISGDLVNDETIHDLEAGEVQIARLFQHDVGHAVGEPTAEVAEPAMMLDRVASVDHVATTVLDFLVHPQDFFRGMLAVIIQYGNISPPRLVQAGQDRIVLAEVACQVNELNAIREFFAELGAGLLAGIRGAIIDQDDLDRQVASQLLDLPYNVANSLAAVVDGDNKRKFYFTGHG